MDQVRKAESEKTELFKMWKATRERLEAAEGAAWNQKGGKNLCPADPSRHLMGAVVSVEAPKGAADLTTGGAVDALGSTGNDPIGRKEQRKGGTLGPMDDGGGATAGGE